MRRTVLIVDDSEINRHLLRRILGDAYTVLEAENGQTALALLHDAHENISAVLLDLLMPVIDGYAVLRQMRGCEELAQIPVVITTGDTDVESEVRALSLGANDFVTKPYNPDVIRHRLWNAINLRETAALINSIQRDKLTGLYNRETFFEKAAEMIAEHEPGYYVLSCLDINGFKVINDQYGSPRGDFVLKHIADAFRDGFHAIGGICCRIASDDFAVLYPARLMHAPEIERIRREASMPDGAAAPIAFSIGRYIVDDPSLPVSAMYDRAVIAAASVKGRFDKQIAQYDESMRKRILREQEIVNGMGAALDAGQFEVWLQPQYNHSTGALIGAEALARWRHPIYGLVPPGDFIPLFERNGFIYELDKYVWEQACLLLKKRMEEGRAPLPISVNLSRHDVLHEDLISVITGFVARYGVPVTLLRLEITESAFAETTDRIIRTVKELIAYGFILEIDDFGSGYSSLNTLKDVPAQVLKLDMRFLEGDENAARGGNILESVVRMAKWLGMSVIAEGVETMAQADYLRSIGCSYVQGYLYARPMPAADYEQLSAKCAAEDKMPSLEALGTLDNDAFWDPASIDTLIFNSYVGSASVFEYYKGKIEVLRINEKYAQTLGGASMSIAEALRVNWEDYLRAADRARLSGTLQRAIQTGREVTDEMPLMGLREAGRVTYLRSSMRVIAHTGERYLFYCMSEDITAQREIEQKERRSAVRRRKKHE